LISRKSIEQKKKEALLSIVGFNTLAIFAILASTFALLQKSILGRIHVLRSQFRNLADRRLSTPFVWPHGDEINDLGIALEEARTILNDYLEAIEEQKKAVEHINLNLEKMVQERSEQLVQSSRLVSLGEMAAGMAHEINNPLAIILGKSTKLRRMIAPQQNASELLPELDKVDSTVHRIGKIIRGLRTFSRDGREDDFESASLGQIIGDTLELCASRFKNHDVDLRVPTLEADLSLECRPVQIGQVLLNLLNNAFDAITELPDKWVELSIHDKGPNLEIWITDSGAGIPQAIRDKLMQPFFTTKPVGKGTGLGLSICRGILQAHHGSFEIDSTCANTRFVLRLPKQQPQTETKAA
jgi:C4-dicarboxylate-specific signal transduction histidine kinase